MLRFFYPQKGCIVYTKKRADGEFWDDTWNSQGNWIKEITPKASMLSAPVKLVKRFCKPEGKVLEAGCGMGQYVFRLSQEGYVCTGIDYAKKTVQTLNQNFPNLDIREMDVFNLSELKPSSYDCYYSGGVIEHFWEGYDGILKMAKRILKLNGIAIFTFPFMSENRKRMSKTIPVLENRKPDNFYQFALDPIEFETKMKKLGFDLLHKNTRNGLKGFIEAYPKFFLLKKLYEYKGKSKLYKCVRAILSKTFAQIGYGHTIEMVFKKISDSNT
jgi:SAM-dependent methyltransferase